MRWQRSRSAARRSLSARRAWIEILWLPFAGLFEVVALRKESVDRNVLSAAVLLLHFVALRKESVDRNTFISTRRPWYMVALRKESVDRNWKLPA